MATKISKSELDILIKADNDLFESGRTDPNHDHGHPKQHPFGKHGEHAHDYLWSETGEYKSKTTRELTEQERKDEGDLL